MSDYEKEIREKLSDAIKKLSDSGLEKLVTYAEGMAAMADLMAEKHAD